MRTRVICVVFLWMVFTIMAVLPVSAQDYSDKDGIYGELSGRLDPDIFGGEIGMYEYPSNTVATRMAFAFLGSEHLDSVLVGFSCGARLALDKRISPFIGLGAFAGYSKETVSAYDDGEDNDDDGLVDEYGEKETVVNNEVACIYPEIGFHLWINDRFRLTFSGRYLVTTEGRKYDAWVFNFGHTFSFD